MQVKLLTEKSKRDWITSVLVNDENASDEEMLQYFIENGLSQAEAVKVMAQRNAALKDPLHFELKEGKPWQKNDRESFDIHFKVTASIVKYDKQGNACEYYIVRGHDFYSIIGTPTKDWSVSEDAIEYEWNWLNQDSNQRNKRSFPDVETAIHNIFYEG
jgi:hypothetical protein